MSCNTKKYSTLVHITDALPVDEVIIVKGGIPTKMQLQEFIQMIINLTKANVPSYIDISAAKSAGLGMDDEFKAANPNIMGVPPGTRIIIS